MTRLSRSVLALGIAAATTLGGAAAAQAAPAPEAPQSAVVAQGPIGDLCSTAKYLHYTAEMLISTVQLQPIFGLIDEPIIHPILWGLIDDLTGGCGVDTHPAEL